MAELTQEERCRYARSIAIDSIGIEGQRKLKESKVMVVGCGALGTVAATYLCASGVGHLAIADFDTIDLSNLQRQIMFMDSDAGKPKCHTLASRLRMLNPTVRIEEIPQMIKEEDAERLFPEFDFIIDGSDNPATKTMTSEVCKRLSKPCCIGGVSEMRGQVLTCVPGSVFWHELFGGIKDSGFLPCAVSGVLGPVPGITGSIQATETIKYITGVGNLLNDRLLTFDSAEMAFSVFRI